MIRPTSLFKVTALFIAWASTFSEAIPGYADSPPNVDVKSIGYSGVVRVSQFVEVVDFTGVDVQGLKDCKNLQAKLGNQLALNYSIAGLAGSQYLSDMNVSLGTPLANGFECGISSNSLFAAIDLPKHTEIFASSDQVAATFSWTYSGVQLQSSPTNATVANPALVANLTWLSPQKGETVNNSFVINLANQPVAPFEFDSFTVKECLDSGCSWANVKVGESNDLPYYTTVFGLSSTALLVEDSRAGGGSSAELTVTAHYVSSSGGKADKSVSQTIVYSGSISPQPMTLAAAGGNGENWIDFNSFHSGFICKNIKSNSSTVSCSLTPSLRYIFKGYYVSGTVSIRLCEWRNLVGFEQLGCGFTDSVHPPIYSKTVQAKFGATTTFTMPTKHTPHGSLYFQADLADLSGVSWGAPDFWYHFK